MRRLAFALLAALAACERTSPVEPPRVIRLDSAAVCVPDTTRASSVGVFCVGAVPRGK